MSGVEEWITIKYLQPGAYIAIMLAVLGVPQMISSYFDLRARRLDRLDNEANAERHHQESLEERREERRREEERRRQDAEVSERRHQDMIALIVASMNNGRNQNDSQNEAINTLQQTVADLQAENARLRQYNGNADT